MQNKQQEYLKQREKLKYVTQGHVSQKVLDPDVMIEQLISDKETFKFNLEPQLPYALPKWLKLQNNLVPALYEQVWQAVKLAPVYQFCDTHIITQFFTTSGLSLEKLGHLWSLSNVCSPGVLTQQELYVMLTLIALVQAGYYVKDTSIMKGINHPILPQLDYSFLNISVANPAINRSANKTALELGQSNTLTFNGFSSTRADTVPCQVKHTDILKRDSVVDVSINQISDPRKSEIDVSFAIPESRKPDYNINLLNLSKTTELDVDFPISATKIHTNPVEYQTPYTNGVKTFDLLNPPYFNSQPKSLDLPVIGTEANKNEDDEFSEFQSAVIIPSSDEYTDFQSASPIVKYELENFMNDENFVIEVPNNFDLTAKPEREAQPDMDDSYSTANDDMRIYKTSHEADKYDVFRSLVEHDEKENKKEEDDDDDEADEEDGEEFGDFYTAANVKPKEKSKMSIKEKCLEACLRLLQEGVTVFSNISSEQTIREVLSDERGYRYLNQLKIVYETSQRFQRQFEYVHLNEALQTTWAKLSSYTKYLPSEDLLEDDAYTEDDVDASLCKLCETKCDVNCVRYAGNHYHVTCINLFLHFVEDAEISAMLNL